MNKKKLFVIIGICILGLVLIGGTTAYYVQTILDDDVSTITHGLDYYINYTKGQNTSGTINPSSTYETDYNTSIELWKKADTPYDLYGHIYLNLDNVSDAMSDLGALKYALVKDGNRISAGTIRKNDDNRILLKGNIPLNTEEESYTVYIWLDEDKINSTISGDTISLTVTCEVTMKEFYDRNVLMIVNTEDTNAETDTFLRSTLLRSEIGSVTFTNTISVPTGNTQIDVSQNKDGSVIMWYGAANSDGKYDVYIGSNGKVKIMDGSVLFSYLTNAATINFANSVDASNVTNMYGMFNRCRKLTTLDLSNFDTSNVTSMAGMFNYCQNLTTLDLSGFDTSNVTDMTAMFNRCQNLTTLDLSNFDTSNVTSMLIMFQSCLKLTTINVSSFNTSKVTTMQNMFYGCLLVQELDLSSFDTSKVTNMNYMFGETGHNFAYKTIYVSERWNTDAVTSSVGMLAGCSNLVGGSGTTFDENYIDKTYARIDDPENGKPGYFTYKAAKA